LAGHFVLPFLPARSVGRATDDREIGKSQGC
jgi:hypothetical protein